MRPAAQDAICLNDDKNSTNHIFLSFGLGNPRGLGGAPPRWVNIHQVEGLHSVRWWNWNSYNISDKEAGKNSCWKSGDTLCIKETAWNLYESFTFITNLIHLLSQKGNSNAVQFVRKSSARVGVELFRKLLSSLRNI